MADTTKVPTKTEPTERPTGLKEWRPFEHLRHEIDRLFDDFGGGFLRSPFARSMSDVESFRHTGLAKHGAPVVDVVEKDNKYEITAELPGMDEKNIEVNLSDGILTIKGEKHEEKEEKKKDYYVSERRYGSFQRSFQVPEGVNTDKIEAAFKNGVLTLSLPKLPEAQKQEKKIAIKKG